MISNEKWLKAQAAERRFHKDPFNVGLNNYYQAYRQYFTFLGMGWDCAGKRILEIGPADYPALTYCYNYSEGFIIEPMDSSILMQLLINKPDLHLVKKPAEDINWMEEFPPLDEVWLFNVLQHVKDPDVIIRNCMESAKRICFFEPINCGTNDCHLWSFDLDYFRKHFGDCVHHYPGDPHARNFHTHECAYGVWNKQ